MTARILTLVAVLTTLAVAATPASAKPPTFANTGVAKVVGSINAVDVARGRITMTVSTNWWNNNRLGKQLAGKRITINTSGRTRIKFFAWPDNNGDGQRNVADWQGGDTVQYALLPVRRGQPLTGPFLARDVMLVGIQWGASWH